MISAFMRHSSQSSQISGCWCPGVCWCQDICSHPADMDYQQTSGMTQCNTEPLEPPVCMTLTNLPRSLYGKSICWFEWGDNNFLGDNFESYQSTACLNLQIFLCHHVSLRCNKHSYYTLTFAINCYLKKNGRNWLIFQCRKSILKVVCYNRNP